MLFLILWCFYLMIEYNLYWNSKSDYRLYTVHLSILITCYFFFKWLTFPRLGTMKCSFKISFFLKFILILYSSVAESLWLSKAVKKPPLYWSTGWFFGRKQEVCFWSSLACTPRVYSHFHSNDPSNPKSDQHLFLLTVTLLNYWFR